MSNSKLVNYTRISPNSSNPRNHKIDTITIHHMSGNLTVETCGSVFAPSSRQASSNYGIDSKGRVGMYVEEKNRSWCSSSPANDNRAVTIEVANDVCGGNWHVSDKALAKLIDLCVDICQRNGIKKLNYTGNTKGNLTMHKWFASTDCPGPYLSSKFPYIAEQVNKRLNEDKTLEKNKTATKKRYDFTDGTIKYLSKHNSPSSLFGKLADTKRKPVTPKTKDLAGYRAAAKKRFGFFDSTMKFLDKHSNPLGLYKKMATKK